MKNRERKFVICNCLHNCGNDLLKWFPIIKKQNSKNLSDVHTLSEYIQPRHTCLIPFQKQTMEEFLYSFCFLRSLLHRSMNHRLREVMGRWIPLCDCFFHGAMWSLGLNAQNQGYQKQRSEERSFFCVCCSWTCVLTLPCQPEILKMSLFKFCRIFIL